MRLLLLLLPAVLLTAQTPAPMKKAAAPKAATKAAPVSAPAVNFKESGSPTAPVQIEIYTDYECPACRDLYLNTLPLLVKQYVQTGKVRLLHRDFPLQQHQFSRIATRYANAAGEIGKYDLVANQIFLTQNEWSQNGNMDAVLSKVLSPADLKKISDIAKSPDTKIDDTVNVDVAMGNRDHLNQTPTIVIIAKGKREVISGGLPFSILKSYIDKKLSE